MLEKGPDAMLSIRNFGEKSLDELRERLVEKGYLASAAAKPRRRGRPNRPPRVWSNRA